MTLNVERKEESDQSPIALPGGGVVLTTPPIDESYWSYRVRLTDTQAILGFPKFGVTGIGFAEEEDWNSNLPSSKSAKKILGHIGHNRGNDAITDEMILEAIELIQAAVKADKDNS